MDTKTRIITGADALFKRRGIRSVTMDDIARELGMSKKTLYQYFSNKADIVHAVTEQHFDEELQMCKEIMANAKDPIAAMVNILKASHKAFQEIPPAMIYDTRKYYPQSWQLFEEFKMGFVRQAILQNLQDGVEAGLYRDDMDLKVVAKLRVESIDIPFDPDRFPPHKYDVRVVHIEQFKLFLHGLATVEGKKRIYQYLNQPDNDE
ncbi:MAG: TetR/AcrR family transcriptional regulator [Bacteroidota bacterium]